MSLINMNTMMILYILTNALCCFFMFLLWRQNCQRSPETVLWLFCYLLQLAGFLLITLRGMISLFLSMIVANTFILAGPFILLIGLELYIGKKSRSKVDYAVLATCFFVHIWFTYIDPNIAVRNINISAGIVYYCCRMAVLLLFGVDSSLKKTVRPVGIVGSLFVAVNLVRIADNVLNPENRGFFDFGTVNSLVLLSNLLLIIALTFVLILMVTRRLLGELQGDLVERKLSAEELRRSEEKFARVFETSPNVVIITKLSDGKILDVNEMFILKFGFTRDEALAGTSISLKLWMYDFDRTAVVSALSHGEVISGREYLFRKKDSTVLVGIFSSKSILLSDGPCILSTIQDITQRKKIEEDLRRNRQLLSDLIDYSSVLICVKFPEGTYQLVNAKWEELTGLRRDFVLGKTDGDLFPANMARQFRDNDLEVMNYDSVREKEELIEGKNGERAFISVKFPLHDASGTIIGICSMMTEITERKRNEELINHMATHDRLTDLPSLSLVKDRLSMALASTKRYGQLTAILFIDLDGFKAVNDTWGHDAGDLVLREVAKRLLACVRHTDTAARIGGDEFLVILTDLQSTDDVAAIADKILLLLAQPIPLGSASASISASIGIALSPGDGDKPEFLIKCADTAMYRVKNGGKNGYAFALSSNNSNTL